VSLSYMLASIYQAAGPHIAEDSNRSTDHCDSPNFTFLFPVL